MIFVEVAPKIDPSTGEIIFPTKRDYLNAWKHVTKNSINKRYFGVYYTGMAQVGTGNWVVLPDKAADRNTHVEYIDLRMVFDLTASLGYKSGLIWMSLDCPFGGNWIL